MRKIAKTVTRTVQEFVEVCDTCGEEKALPITWHWSINCPHDDCYSDFGSMQFCSVACFHAGLGKALEMLNDDEQFHTQRFELEVEGDEYDGHDEMNALLTLLHAATKQLT